MKKLGRRMLVAIAAIGGAPVASANIAACDASSTETVRQACYSSVNTERSNYKEAIQAAFIPDAEKAVFQKNQAIYEQKLAACTTSACAIDASHEYKGLLFESYQRNSAAAAKKANERDRQRSEELTAFREEGERRQKEANARDAERAQQQARSAVERHAWLAAELQNDRSFLAYRELVAQIKEHPYYKNPNDFRRKPKTVDSSRNKALKAEKDNFELMLGLEGVFPDQRADFRANQEYLYKYLEFCETQECVTVLAKGMNAPMAIVYKSIAKAKDSSVMQE